MAESLCSKSHALLKIEHGFCFIVDPSWPSEGSMVVVFTEGSRASAFLRFLSKEMTCCSGVRGKCGDGIPKILIRALAAWVGLRNRDFDVSN